MSRVLSTIVGLATLLVLCVAHGQVPARARLQLDSWSLSGDADLDARAKGSANDPDRRLELSIEGRRYDIDLRPAQSVLAGLPVAQRRANATTQLYRGTLSAMPGAWARVTVAGDELYVLLWDGRDFIAVEPQQETHGSAAPGKGTAGTRHQAYRPLAYERPSFIGDTRVPADEPASGFSPAIPVAKNQRYAFGKANVNARLQVAWVADSVFSDRFGTSTEAEMLARINVVSGIFAEQLGLQLELVELTALADGDDPFSTSDASRLLDEVEQEKLSTSSRREAAILHLLTGRALEGSTVGIATVGSACSARFGVSLTEARRPAAVDALIAAHEIGHNLNAPHDGDGVCTSVPAGFLMAPKLSQNDEFSSCSIDVMVDYLQRAFCVLDLLPSDVAIRADAPADVLIGASTTLEYLIDSPSDRDVLDLTLAITFDRDGLSLRRATLDGGTCTTSEQRVDCTLGQLAAGDSAVLRLTVAGAAIGSWPLDVAVSAPGDSDLSNNAVESLITVRPAADLSVRFDQGELLSAPGAARRVPFSVANDGPLVAPGVVLEFTAEEASLLTVESLDGCTAQGGGGWRCQLGQLEVGARLSGELVAQASAEPLRTAARREALRASIRSAYADPVLENNEDVSDLVVAQVVADLATRVLAAASEIEIGESQLFELEILNNGPDRASSVLLEVALSLASVNVVEATVGEDAVACAIDGTAVSCQLEALEVGEVSTVRLVLQALAGERLRLRTSVSGAEYDPSGGNDQSTSDLTVSGKLAPVNDESVAAGPPAAAAAAPGAGGGGAFSPLALLALGLFAGGRRRGRPRSGA